MDKASRQKHFQTSQQVHWVCSFLVYCSFRIRLFANANTCFGPHVSGLNIFCKANFSHLWIYCKFSELQSCVSFSFLFSSSTSYLLFYESCDWHIWINKTPTTSSFYCVFYVIFALLQCLADFLLNMYEKHANLKNKFTKVVQVRSW